MELLNKAKSWIKSRIAERTSWDGAIILGGSLVLLFLPHLVIDLALYATALYGAWTIWKEESK